MARLSPDVFQSDSKNSAFAGVETANSTANDSAKILNRVRILTPKVFYIKNSKKNGQRISVQEKIDWFFDNSVRYFYGLLINYDKNIIKYNKRAYYCK
jgi:hypothetical protein